MDKSLEGKEGSLDEDAIVTRAQTRVAHTVGKMY